MGAIVFTMAAIYFTQDNSILLYSYRYSSDSSHNYLNGFLNILFNNEFLEAKTYGVCKTSVELILFQYRF